MKISEKFTRNIYWPYAQKLKEQSARVILKGLLESQWFNKEKIIENQWKQLRKTVNKAAIEVPYYNKVYRDIGWDFKNFEFDYDDFIKLPIITKSDIQNDTTGFLNPNYSGRITKGNTSGSTGRSLELFYCSEHESYSEAARWRGKSWWGILPGSRQISLWGRPYSSPLDRAFQNFKSRLMNTKLFSAFDLSQNNLNSVYEKIIKFNPEIIYGYPSAISTIASYVKKNKISKVCNNTKVVMITAESSNVVQRGLIEEVFKCKTANEYGCSETGGFVYECQKGNWHISSELTFVEFLDKGGNPVDSGEKGSIHLTHLRNNYMPLIRYRVGDIGTALDTNCECGLGLPLMDVSVSKERDHIRLPNGDQQTSEILVYINKAVQKKYPNSILQFRAIQDAIDNLGLEIVEGDFFSKEAEEYLRKLLNKHLSDSIRINIKRTLEIEREENGKLRYFISRLI